MVVATEGVIDVNNLLGVNECVESKAVSWFLDVAFADWGHAERFLAAARGQAFDVVLQMWVERWWVRIGYLAGKKVRDCVF